MAKTAHTHPGRRGREAQVSLQTKQQPVQQRAIDTFELILQVTGRLLGEVGVERLSTNLICEAAGITPPALYRYFPNKYAILKELGERLMAAQNKAYRAWVDKERHIPYDGTHAGAVRRLKDMQAAINEATWAFPGAIWVMRALRALPVLQQVLFDSHESVSETSYQALRGRFPHAEEDALRFAMRLSTEVMYSATEMVMDNPHLDADMINGEVAEMVVRYYDKFVENEARHAEAARRGRGARVPAPQPRAKAGAKAAARGARGEAEAASKAAAARAAGPAVAKPAKPAAKPARKASPRGPAR
jgi:AcrR family transcriptional regulator